MVFNGQVYSLEFSTSVLFKQKQSYRRAITDNGGVVSYVLNKNCTAHLVSQGLELGTKSRRARQMSIPVVPLAFINQCLDGNSLLDFRGYQVHSESEDLKHGKLSCNSASTVPSSINTKAKQYRNQSVRLDLVKPTSDDLLDEFTLLKWVAFKLIDVTVASCSVLEVHQIIGVTSHEFRVASFSTHLSSRGNDCGDIKRQFRYFSSLNLAADAFEQLARKLDAAPKSERLYENLPLGLGSAELVQLLSTSGMNQNQTPNDDVLFLVRRIWREALGKVGELFDVDYASLSLKNINEAESYLVELKAEIQKNSSAGILAEISQKFYKSLKTNSSEFITNKRQLIAMMEFIQLLRDLITVSEVSSAKSDLSNYFALNCHIEAVDLNSIAYQHLMESIDPSFRKSIGRIFQVKRPIEIAKFQSQIGNEKMLFHGSKTENFLGLLARGILPPKAVVSDFGVSRTDIGHLGCGVYFSDEFKTSIKYTRTGQFGQRWLLCCKVVLGKCFETDQSMPELVEPPIGFSSVHGSKWNETSFFQESEYAVYSVDQVELCYLIEIVDDHSKMQQLSVEALDRSIDCAEFSALNYIEIDSIKNKIDPNNNIKCGLVVNGANPQLSSPVLLQQLHIRASLVDLVGQVTIMEVYQSKSDQTLEAKYIFPLDGTAAVCGFEAYINDKHVVGRCEEKSQARKEYREAVSAGHGAYLMEEEKPDVFTVSIGNLPAYCRVLIKIIYVCELDIDAELISFRLPAVVSSFDGKLVDQLAEATQDKTGTVKVINSAPEAENCSVEISVRMPYEIKTIWSPSHSVKVKKTESDASVVLCNQITPFDSNFQLLIRCSQIHVPRMWSEMTPEGQSEASMVVFYPEFDTKSDPMPDVRIFIDCSNSMTSDSMQPFEHAKQTALLIVDQLFDTQQQNVSTTQGKSFVGDVKFMVNVVRFHACYEECFVLSSVLLTEKTKLEMETFIRESKPSNSNTNLLGSMKSVLVKKHSFVTNVILISDGHVTYQDECLRFCHGHVDNVRMFTFGVGPSFNTHYLNALSLASGGAFEPLDPGSKFRWRSKLNTQIWRLCQPSVTNVTVDWAQEDMGNVSDLVPRQTPSLVNALFSGDRVVVLAFTNHCYQATLKATLSNGHEISTKVMLNQINKTEGVLLHRLATKGIIKDWSTGVLKLDNVQDEFEKRQLRARMIELSKEFSVLCPLTSFVAIEERSEAEKKNQLNDFNFDATIKTVIDQNLTDNLTYIDWQEDPMSRFTDIIKEVERLLYQADSAVSLAEATRLFNDAIDVCTRHPNVIPKSLAQRAETERERRLRLPSESDTDEHSEYYSSSECESDSGTKLRGKSAVQSFIPIMALSGRGGRTRQSARRSVGVPIGQQLSESYDESATDSEDAGSDDGSDIDVIEQRSTKIGGRSRSRDRQPRSPAYEPTSFAVKPAGASIPRSGAHTKQTARMSTGGMSTAYQPAKAEFTSSAGAPMPMSGSTILKSGGARTKQTARMSTGGGKAPRIQLATMAISKSESKMSEGDSEEADDDMRGGSSGAHEVQSNKPTAPVFAPMRRSGGLTKQTVRRSMGNMAPRKQLTTISKRLSTTHQGGGNSESSVLSDEPASFPFAVLSSSSTTQPVVLGRSGVNSTVSVGGAVRHSKRLDPPHEIINPFEVMPPNHVSKRSGVSELLESDLPHVKAKPVEQQYLMLAATPAMAMSDDLVEAMAADLRDSECDDMGFGLFDEGEYVGNADQGEDFDMCFEDVGDDDSEIGQAAISAPPPPSVRSMNESLRVKKKDELPESSDFLKSRINFAEMSSARKLIDKDAPKYKSLFGSTNMSPERADPIVMDAAYEPQMLSMSMGVPETKSADLPDSEEEDDDDMGFGLFDGDGGSVAPSLPPRLAKAQFALPSKEKTPRGRQMIIKTEMGRMPTGTKYQQEIAQLCQITPHSKNEAAFNSSLFGGGNQSSSFSFAPTVGEVPQPPMSFGFVQQQQQQPPVFRHRGVMLGGGLGSNQVGFGTTMESSKGGQLFGTQMHPAKVGGGLFGAPALSAACTTSKFDDVQEIMKHSIENVLERGERLNNLVEKSEMLQENAKMFQKKKKAAKSSAGFSSVFNSSYSESSSMEQFDTSEAKRFSFGFKPKVARFHSPENFLLSESALWKKVGSEKSMQDFFEGLEPFLEKLKSEKKTMSWDGLVIDIGETLPLPVKDFLVKLMINMRMNGILSYGFTIALQIVELIVLCLFLEFVYLAALMNKTEVKAFEFKNCDNFLTDSEWMRNRVENMNVLLENLDNLSNLGQVQKDIEHGKQLFNQYGSVIRDLELAVNLRELIYSVRFWN